MIHAGPSFFMISYNPQVFLNALDCFLFTRRVVVNEVYHQNIKYQLLYQPAYYNFMETIACKFTIPSGQREFIQEMFLKRIPIRGMAITMKTYSALTGHLLENLFNYQKFGLRGDRFICGGRAIISIDTTNDCRAYVTTMKSMNLNEEIHALSNHHFQNQYVLVLDLTSFQDTGENIHCPELSGESIQLKRIFNRCLSNLTGTIVQRERTSTVKIDQFRTVAKNVL